MSGHFADRAGGRRLIALGAVVSCALNWLGSFASGFWTLAIPWALNGCAQSMGFAPASRLIAAWWAPSERGRAYGVLNGAAGLSSVLTYTTAALVIAWLSWRWVLRLPVLLLLLGAAVVWCFARDRPEDLGFPPVTDPGAAGSGPDAAGETREPDVSFGTRVRDALQNRAFVLASLGFGFANWARLGLLVWAPSHLLASGAAAKASWVSLALPMGMALGAFVGGYTVDRFFAGNHPRMIVISLLLAAGVSLGLLMTPPDARSLVLLFAAGLLIFSPFPSFTVLGAELLGPQCRRRGRRVHERVRLRHRGARRRGDGNGDRRDRPYRRGLRGGRGGVPPRGGGDGAGGRRGPPAALTRPNAGPSCYDTPRFVSSQRPESLATADTSSRGAQDEQPRGSE